LSRRLQGGGGRGGLAAAMDVHLCCCHGFPEGSLLSVRAGDARRQAAAELGKALRFPPEVAQCNELQVDVLAVLGRAKLELRPSTGRYAVEFSGTQDRRTMSCEVEVQRPSGPAASLKASVGRLHPLPAAAGARTGVALRHELAFQQGSAKSYMEHHSLAQVVQGALKLTAVRQPEKPLHYMAQLLLAAAAEREAAAAKAGASIEAVKAEAFAEAPVEAGSKPWRGAPRPRRWSRASSEASLGSTLTATEAEEEGVLRATAEGMSDALLSQAVAKAGLGPACPLPAADPGGGGAEPLASPPCGPSSAPSSCSPRPTEVSAGRAEPPCGHELEDVEDGDEESRLVLRAVASQALCEALGPLRRAPAGKPCSQEARQELGEHHEEDEVAALDTCRSEGRGVFQTVAHRFLEEALDFGRSAHQGT